MAGLESSLRINQFIDHTILKVGTRPRDIERYCQEVIEYNFHSVCIPPFYVPQARRILKEGRVVSVAGFPLGSETTKIKCLQIEELKTLGVDEVDVVFNIGMLLEKDYRFLREELRNLQKTAEDIVLKVIVETPLLTRTLLEDVTRLLVDGGVDFIKTGTGFSGPVRVSEVRTISRITQGKIGIKAAGRIRTYDQAVKLIRAGATRIGTSTGVRIIRAC